MKDDHECASAPPDAEPAAARVSRDFTADIGMEHNFTADIGMEHSDPESCFKNSIPL
jgi:hypothetical protein